MKEIPNCQVCHHQDRAGTSRSRACSDCHKVRSEQDLLVQADLFSELDKVEYKDEIGPPPMVAYHGKCIGCHKAMKKGPVVCRDCHTPGSTGSHGSAEWSHFVHSRKMDIGKDTGHETSCAVCHHHDQEAKTEADYRACSTCHDASSILGQPVATGLKGIDGVSEISKHQGAKHGECGRCHVEQNPEDDTRSCKDCHLPWKFDKENQERPNLEQALHQRCQECHNESNPEATVTMPLRCNDCHEHDPSWLSSPEIGNLLWSHKWHGMYREMECETCHHKDLPGERHMACRKCHETGLYDNPSFKEALSKRCIGCHLDEKTGLDQWDLLATDKPTVEYFRIESEEGSFWWNHHEHALGDSFSCQECHHNISRKDGVYLTSLRAKKPWPKEARRIQSCRNCHGEQGPVVGSPAEGTKAPPVGQVFREACVTCHQRLGGGPQSWEDFFAKARIVWEDEQPQKAGEEGAS